MPAKLSTHVLDTAHGCPAQGMKIELWSLDGEDRTLVTTAKSNADGRTDAPLLAADEMKAGHVALSWHGGRKPTFLSIASAPPAHLVS